MKLTKQQKLLAGVLALGVTAVGVDRMWLSTGGPQSASAAASASAAGTAIPATLSPTPAPAATPTATSPTAAAAVEITQRLVSLSATRQDGGELAPPLDVFAVPWFAAAADAVGDADANPDADADAKLRDDAGAGLFAATAKPFQERHTLMAVIAGGAEVAVVLDGRAVRVGQIVDEHTLVAASGNTAVFRGEKGLVRLHVRR